MSEPTAEAFDGATSLSVPSPDVKQIRPWIRYWARGIDITLYKCCFLLAGGFVIHYFPVDFSGVLIGAVFILGYCVVEAMFLSKWGATPGKILLRTSVRTSDGSLLSYSAAFHRSFKVWFLGMGFGLFPLSLFIIAISYNILTKKGMTPWDSSGGFRVVHRRIGLLRFVSGILLIFSLLVGISLVFYLGAQ